MKTGCVDKGITEEVMNERDISSQQRYQQDSS